MTKYSIQVNSKGTILSLTVENPDPIRFPTRGLIGRNFCRLIGWDCRRDLQLILRNISRTHQPARFSTFIAPKGAAEGPVMEWTIHPKGRTLLLASKYVLYGTEPE
ncbi:MAG TPA: hypothetical protein VGM30_01165 [Puia sp.]|jgi:hypothetical protein